MPFKSAIVLARGDGGGLRLVFVTARITTDGARCASVMAVVSGKAVGG